MSDASKALLKRFCRDADEQAFTRFYRSQADRLWRFLCARGCDAESAYELVADAFLSFVQVVCRDPSHPTALLYRIAINRHTDWRRRQARSPVVSTADPPDAAGAGPDGRDSEAAYLRELMQGLPENEQILLLMRYWIGLSHREIATVLDRPAGTVRRQCAAALASLRRRWQESGE